MKITKTWATVHFSEGKAKIEVTLNYNSGTFSMSHDSNDRNVTFEGNKDDFKVHLDRVKCITAALKYIQQELS